jgi:polar amino acid transport system ATP-binding protein
MNGARRPAVDMGPVPRSTPVLEVREVSKSFGEREVLKGVDLEIREHQAVALIGASGSGKSTLLRCVDLLEDIDDGDVLLDGEVITDPSVDTVAVRRRLGLVFQAYNLFPHMTALQNVVLGARRAHRVSKPEAEERGRELLGRFGLGGREDDRPDELSGGQQQRVAIARAFAGQPRALQLDEVTSALDPELVGEVLRAVRDLKEDGMTMVIATHEMAFARDVADQLGIEGAGDLVEEHRAGAAGEGAGDRDPLLLAAGKVVGPVVLAAGETEAGKHRPPPLLGLGARFAVGAALAEDDVLQRGHVGEEVVGLEDEPEAAANRDRVDGRIGDRLAVEEDVAIVDVLEQVDAAQQGRLARARGADQRHRFVLAHGQVDPPQHLALAEGFGHAADLEHRGAGRCAHRTAPSGPPIRSTIRAVGIVTAR